MRCFLRKFTPAVAAFVLIFSWTASQSAAESDADRLDELFAQLQEPLDGNWQSLQSQIEKLWSRSGSDSMDLLLERGRKAIEDGNYPKAVEHLTALTDHAPGFAEGWNARATAFFLMKKYGLSISDIQKTLALNPRHFGALVGLGQIYEELDDPEAALRAYEAAQTIHPARPDILQSVERLRDQTKGQSL